MESEGAQTHAVVRSNDRFYVTERKSVEKMTSNAVYGACSTDHSLKIYI